MRVLPFGRRQRQKAENRAKEGEITAECPEIRSPRARHAANQRTRRMSEGEEVHGRRASSVAMNAYNKPKEDRRSNMVLPRRNPAAASRRARPGWCYQILSAMLSERMRKVSPANGASCYVLKRATSVILRWLRPRVSVCDEIFIRNKYCQKNTLLARTGHTNTRQVGVVKHRAPRAPPYRRPPPFRPRHTRKTDTQFFSRPACLKAHS